MWWRNLFLLAGCGLCQSQNDRPNTAPIIAALRAGHYLEAHSLLDTALKQSPDDERLWTLDGFALAHLGDTKSALRQFQHALELKPDYLPGLEGEAEIEYNASDQHAVPLLKKILQVRPKDETTHAMLAALAYQRRDCATATEEFAQSGARIDSQIVALEEYGSCLVKVRRIADAIPVFQRLADIQPDDNKARYNLAVVESLVGRQQDVITALRPLIRKDPVDADALELLAEAYEATSETPQAVQLLRDAIVAKPDVPQYYLDFANLCFVHASYHVGVDMIDAGLRRIPKSAPLYLARGILYVQLGKYDNADNDFAEAERLDPSVQFGSSAQGLERLQRDDLEQAEATIREHLRKTPRDAFLHYLLAETLARRGVQAGTPEFEEAVSAAQKAIEIDPNFGLARDVLGALYLQQGRTKEAIEQSRLAFKEDPTDQTALYHLMTALRKSNETSELRGLAKKLAELREQSRAQEAAEHKYALVEPGSAEHLSSGFSKH